MKTRKIFFSSATAALLITGGLAFAGFDSTPQSQYVGLPFGGG